MTESICINCSPTGISHGTTGWLKIRRYFDGWRLAALAISMGVVLPLAVIFLHLLHPEKEIWQHLAQTMLADLLFNTALLTGGVLIGTFVLGVSLAWLTGVCEFPGRSVLSWALLLPMAMPAYVLAFVMLGLFDFSGPVQSTLRQWLPSYGRWFPEVRSAGGVIVVMTFALYPYVYLLARSAFKTQGRRALEAARALGYSQWAAFYKVALPMARPWIAGGLMLVLMETLADFGAVSIFNFDTFTTAIYKAWYGFFSLAAAAQLSAMLVVIVFLVIVIEQRMRSKMRYTQSGRMTIEPERIVLKGFSRNAATIFTGGVFLVAFGIPFVQLIIWVGQVFAEEFSSRYLEYMFHSFLFAAMATVLIVAGAICLAYTSRKHPDRFSSLMVRLSTMGYALPGPVLAVGIFIVFTLMDRGLVAVISPVVNLEGAQILQNTILIVLAAYVVRFMAAGFNAVNSAMHRLTPSIDEAAVSLGTTGFHLIRRIHLPILKNGLLTAAVMSFVDVMKEMPITLMTRPFGWDTLAVKIFELTSEGEWERAALPAVVLVLGGLIPVILLTHKMDAGSNTN